MPVKPTVVLLHGFTENSGIWNEVRKELNADLEVLTPDLPGFGKNDAVVQSINQMADDVIRFMDKFDVSRCTLIGHSMGGYVALNLARRFRERVAALGMFHSNASSDSEEKKAERMRISEHIKANGPEAFLSNMSKSLLGPSNQKNAELLQLVYNQIKDAKADGLMNALKVMANRQSEMEFLRNAQIPILWVAGIEDQFMSWNDVLRQATQCPKAMWHLLENSGHLGMFEEFEQSIVILKEFLDWVNN